MRFDGLFGFGNRHSDNANTAIRAQRDFAIGSNEMLTGDFLLSRDASQGQPDSRVFGNLSNPALNAFTQLVSCEPGRNDRRKDAIRLARSVDARIDIVVVETKNELTVRADRELSGERNFLWNSRGLDQNYIERLEAIRLSRRQIDTRDRQDVRRFNDIVRQCGLGEFIGNGWRNDGLAGHRFGLRVRTTRTEKKHRHSNRRQQLRSRIRSEENAERQNQPVEPIRNSEMNRHSASSRAPDALSGKSEKFLGLRQITWEFRRVID